MASALKGDIPDMIKNDDEEPEGFYLDQQLENP